MFKYFVNMGNFKTDTGELIPFISMKNGEIEIAKETGKIHIVSGVNTLNVCTKEVAIEIFQEAIDWIKQQT